MYYSHDTLDLLCSFSLVPAPPSDATHVNHLGSETTTHRLSCAKAGSPYQTPELTCSVVTT